MNRKILDLAIPNIISNITVPLLSMVDLTLMGHLKSSIYIGAVALGGIIFNFLYWGFSFLRMGTSGLTGQAYGRQDSPSCYNHLGRALTIGLISGLVLILLQVPISHIAFQLLQGSEEVEHLAKEYFFIRIYAAPATLAMYGIMGWFVGVQNAKYPLYIALLINIVNILANLFFVYILDCKSAGVAIGTVLAQYSGLLASVILLYSRYGKGISFIRWKRIWDKMELVTFFHLNKDIFFRTLCIIVVFTFFTSSSASHSDDILAVNSLLLQYLMFFSFFMDGFAYAGEALSAKYFGQRSGEKIRLLIKRLMQWGFVISILYTLVYAFAGNFIFQLLTSNSEVIDAAQPYMLWVVAMPILSFIAFVWDGIYIGVTASKGMRNTMLIATFVCFFPVWFLFSPYLGNHALWMALLFFMFSRGFMQFLASKRYIYNKLNHPYSNSSK